METFIPPLSATKAFFQIGISTDRWRDQPAYGVGYPSCRPTMWIPAADALTPSPDALPIFFQDSADNVVKNSDFSRVTNGSPTAWQGESATIAVEPGHGVSGNALRVTGTTNGRVLQTLTFDAPLGGRQFVLSLSRNPSPLLASSKTCSLKWTAAPLFVSSMPM